MDRLDQIFARVTVGFMIQDAVAELLDDCENIEEFYDNPLFDEDSADEEMTSSDEAEEFYFIQRKSDRRKTVKSKPKAKLRDANMLCNIWRFKIPKKRIERLNDLFSKDPECMALRYFMKLNSDKESGVAPSRRREVSIAKRERILRRENRNIRAKYLGAVDTAELFEVFE